MTTGCSESVRPDVSYSIVAPLPFGPERLPGSHLASSITSRLFFGPLLWFCQEGHLCHSTWSATPIFPAEPPSPTLSAGVHPHLEGIHHSPCLLISQTDQQVDPSTVPRHSTQHGDVAGEASPLLPTLSPLQAVSSGLEVSGQLPLLLSFLQSSQVLALWHRDGSQQMPLLIFCLPPPTGNSSASFSDLLPF